MESLRTLAMGLVVVFLDVGPSGWDWVADPVGWILVLLGLSSLKESVPNHRGLTLTAWVCLGISVLTFSPNSVDQIDEGLGWLFSLPTIAFSFLVCDAVSEVADESLAARLRLLRNLYVPVGALPLLVYGFDWEWLTVPTAVAAVVANIALVLWLWDAGAEQESDEGLRVKKPDR